MIGIFDSGVGGFNALFEIRRRLPFADIAYFADEKNAPYGTKSEDQLLKLVKKDAEILKGIGASEILIACCTASTVFERLNEEEKRNLTPIIAPAAHRGKASAHFGDCDRGDGPVTRILKRNLKRKSVLRGI